MRHLWGFQQTKFQPLIQCLLFTIYVKNVDKFKSQRDHISLSTIRNVHKMTKDKKDD